MRVEPNPAHAATEPERAAVDRALARLGADPRAPSRAADARTSRQERIGGLSPGALENLVVTDVVPPRSAAWRPSTRCSRRSRAAGVVHVCDDVACICAGCRAVVELEAGTG